MREKESASSRYRKAKEARRQLSNIRMVLSMLGEVYYISKNIVDHAVAGSERAIYREKYIPHKLEAYRGQPRVAFLFHGYFQSRSAWERLERFMESELFNIYAIAMSAQPYSQDLRITAEQELKTINYILEHLDAKEIYIIGHSQGGLLARQIVQKLNFVENVKDCITLSTPNQGTIAGHAGGMHKYAVKVLSRLPNFPKIKGESGLQMVPNSDFLNELNSLPLPKGVTFTSIYNYIDPLVWPASYCRIPNPEAYNILMRKIGHLHALYNEQIFEIILKTIFLEPEKGRKKVKSRVLVGREVLEQKRFEKEGLIYNEIVTSSD